MNKRDLNEAMATMQPVLTALLATLGGTSGAPGAQLRFTCGQLAANGGALLDARNPTFWDDFADCFDNARLAGATVASMDAVRAAASVTSPTGIPAIAVMNFAVRMALAEEAQILAATTFASREDIDNYFNQINAAFDDAESVAANALDKVAYRALIALHAAVSDDLANRARPLPRMVSYTFPNRMPSLWMVQRLYYDASRNDELIGENKPVHPLFMPSSGVALSA